jgi:dihydrofolate synthase / folylpolyglutamate synthase
MTYAGALAYLDAHVNYQTGVVNDRAGVAPWVASPVSAGSGLAPRRLDPPSLSRMRNLLHFLGDPHFDLQILHITGTNGKGSTARMATELLLASGLSVGTLISPHLVSINERLARNGEPITDEAFAEVMGAVALAERASGERCSHFELVTAAAFRWFGDLAVESAVIEVGAGGRWDATNVADGLVAAITNISLDHMEWFGDTTLDIAREKVGIVKSGAVAVIGETDPVLADYLARESCAAGAAEIWMKGVDFAADSNRVAVGGRICTLRTPTTTYRDVVVPLHGAHQGENASVALTAVEGFLGAPLAADIVQAGFAVVTHPGRMEIIDRAPLTILDGAHNPAGAAAAARTLDEEFAANPGRVIVMGLLVGRDPGEVIDALEADRAHLVVVCPPPSPRAMDPQIIVGECERRGIRAIVERDIRKAVAIARSEAASDDCVLITGSLYLVGAVRGLLVS